MFGIGFPEMIIILILIVLVVGPEQLPDVARKGISFIKEAKKHISNIKAEVDKQTEPLRQPLEEMMESTDNNADIAMQERHSQSANKDENHPENDHKNGETRT